VWEHRGKERHLICMHGGRQGEAEVHTATYTPYSEGRR
jgi:hypothetical protein